ncbi:hypothetical protein ACOME3_008586 [Neoechinorhynchus agilis]
MLNLFVAVIMDNFDYLTRDSSILGAHHLDEFVRAWSEYDPEGTGLLHYTEMFEMLRNISPPVGFGGKCPNRLAYRKLIRMNIPIDDDGKVYFTTTLFTLIRESLSIKMRLPEEMDKADAELRECICRLWPEDAQRLVRYGNNKKIMLDLLVPPYSDLHGMDGRRKLTVGKIYAGLIILDNWKTSRGESYGESRYRTTGSTFTEMLFNMVNMKSKLSGSGAQSEHMAALLRNKLRPTTSQCGQIKQKGEEDAHVEHQVKIPGAKKAVIRPSVGFSQLPTDEHLTVHKVNTRPRILYKLENNITTSESGDSMDYSRPPRPVFLGFITDSPFNNAEGNKNDQHEHHNATSDSGEIAKQVV